MKANATARAPRVHSDRSAPQTPLQMPQGAFRALIPQLQRAVAAEGYATPTPIQEQCIPHLLEGRDLLGIAQTGTGKTAAFALPLLQRFSESPHRLGRGAPRALIRTYGRYLRLSHAVIFGGVAQLPQVAALNRGVDILVATPGRLLDLMEQGYIHLNEVEVLILDEVDRMLDMGFVPDIKRVLSQIPAERQTLFFSATMAPSTVALANSMVRDPVRVTITPDEPAVERIDQKVLFVGKQDKISLLLSLLGDTRVDKVLVFTQMKHVANRVVEKLSDAGIRGAALHGNKTQAARTKALEGFKRGRFRVLVATDVAARGLDVDDITHVINFDLPMEAETYVHRIGRTARAGASGAAISFCSPEDRAYLRDIERLLGKPVPAELGHAFHCERAVRSDTPAPKNFGRNRGGGWQGGRGRQMQRRSYR